MTGKKEKILIVKLSSLGDILHNIPLANQLKKAGYEVIGCTMNLLDEPNEEAIKDAKKVS